MKSEELMDSIKQVKKEGHKSKFTFKFSLEMVPCSRMQRAEYGSMSALHSWKAAKEGMN
jgi:hypothetical protein